MDGKWLRLLTLGLLAASLAFAGCGSGSDGANGADGADGTDGMDGQPGGSMIDVSQVSDDFLEGLDLTGKITSVAIASPPVVTFTLETTAGVPVTGIVPYWTASNRYVRFTIAKLVPGANGDPDSWVAYTRDATSGEPDYDTGASLVDNGDGSYTFTFLTDVANVAGVPYEDTLTHRVAGQLGSNSEPIEPQNYFYDYVPSTGGAPTLTRNIAVMASCNECHDDLVFHGRRFEVEYCVNCHNPDLSSGEGDMAYMTHKIHASGTFDILDDAIDYSYVTYPQDLANCRKCHDGADAATAQGDNWKTVPSIQACGACHDVFSPGSMTPHTGGPQSDNAGCVGCHSPAQIEGYHLTDNATPNNPDVRPGQYEISYELVDAEVVTGNDLVVKLKIFTDAAKTMALDLTNLPADLLPRRPGLLLAYALPQDGIAEPMDYNNLGQRGGQPVSVSLTNPPTVSGTPVGTLSFSGDTNTVTLNVAAGQFPLNATLRAVGLQGYFQQDVASSTVSLHTPSAVVAVKDDDERRTVVDSAKCAACHEWFEGHGGNRVYDIAICTVCHLPNTSSSGRTIPVITDMMDPDYPSPSTNLVAAIDAALADGSLDPSVNSADPLTYPEDAQNLKDMVHGIHAAEVRDRHYQHVRGGRQGYYDWEHVSFPRGASPGNCALCHDGDTYTFPLDDGLLATTVRTTAQLDGLDPTTAAAEAAFLAVPNGTDWINSPMASSCFYCHTSNEALAHMVQNGAMLAVPDGSEPVSGVYRHRMDMGMTFEICTICHGEGKSSDVQVVHGQ